MGIMIAINITCVILYRLLNNAALAVYTRSPAAYESLRSFKLLQLPSIRTLQHYVSANREDAGECMDRLEQERRKYVELIEERRRALENHTGTCMTSYILGPDIKNFINACRCSCQCSTMWRWSSYY